MKKISAERRHTIYTFIYSITILAVMMFSMFALSGLTNGDSYFPLFFSLVFFSLGLSNIFLMIRAGIEKIGKFDLVKYLIFIFIFLTLGTLSITLPDAPHSFAIICGVYYLAVTLKRVLLLIKKHTKVFRYIFNGFLAVLFFFLSITAFLSQDTEAQVNIILACITIIVIASIIEILAFAFVRIQLKGLIKIMRKTYSFEVLYGLLMLVISFSLYFTMTEQDIKTFGDGLWYSFAVITTIGFGDKVVFSPVSRVLSVILGCYGILVVAVITSIIVNFYNENKDKDDKPDDKENKDDDENKKA